jgi:hypothetical protein
MSSKQRLDNPADTRLCHTDCSQRRGKERHRKSDPTLLLQIAFLFHRHMKLSMQTTRTRL